MLMVIHNPAHIDLFVLTLEHNRQPAELLYFTEEENLKQLFPEAQWQGRAQPGCRATYVRSRASREDVAAMGNKVYENAYRAHREAAR